MQDINEDYLSTLHSKKHEDTVCLTCNRAISPECIVVNEHEGHKIGTIKEGLEKLIIDVKNNLPVFENIMGVLKDNRKMILELITGKMEKLTIMKQKTEANLNELIEIIGKKKKELLGTISDKIQELNEEKKEIETADTQYKVLIEACKTRPEDTCKIYSDLIKSLEDFRKLKTLTDKLPSMNMEVELSKSYPPISLQEFFTLAGNMQLPKELTDKKSETISFESNIVKSKEDQELLGKWITEACGSSFSLQLLWRGSTDSYRVATFHSKCDDKGPTLTIIRSNKDYVFGGYTAKSWKSSGGFVSDPTAFIYSLTHKAKHAKQKSDEYSIFCRANYGPTFGSGNDIYIVDKCNSSDKNYSNGNHTYELPAGVEIRTYFAGTDNFKVKEIEVYSVKVA